jgi:hypothetical protein
MPVGATSTSRFPLPSPRTYCTVALICICKLLPESYLYLSLKDSRELCKLFVRVHVIPSMLVPYLVLTETSII